MAQGRFVIEDAAPAGGGQGRFVIDDAPAKTDAGMVRGTVDMAGNIGSGLLRGAGSIGSTLISAFQHTPTAMALRAAGVDTGINGDDRRKQMDDGLKSLGADPESLSYQGGKLVGEIAGTSGVGGVLAKGAQAVGAGGKAINALQSGGFNLGAPAATTLATRAGDVALRAGGGGAGGAAAAGLANPDDAALGAGIGAVLPGSIRAVGSAGATVAGGLRSGAERLMQSALKPTLKQLKSGDAKIAIETLLDAGISPTASGVEKLRAGVGDINDEITKLIQGSGAKIDKEKIINALWGTRNKFGNQVDPAQDLAAIQTVADGFSAHPKLAGLNAKELELADAVKRAGEARISALQDAGRFQTMAAQQAELANGGRIQLRGDRPASNLHPEIPGQTPNTPYFNVGAEGGSSVSPQAFPVTGQPRFPGRYTENFQRVPEAEAAALEAKRIVGQRAFEQQKAQLALEKYIAEGGSGIPVQLAQELKQGTYRVLKGKYGETGSASTEAQKALARGLKEGIAEAVPEVAGLNAMESRVLKTLGVAERRALMDSNKNTMGLASLAHHPIGWAAFMADRSAAFKGMAARMANRASKVNPGRSLADLLENPAARTGLIQYADEALNR